MTSYHNPSRVYSFSQVAPFFRGQASISGRYVPRIGPFIQAPNLNLADFIHSGSNECLDLAEKTVSAGSIIPDIQETFGTTFLQQDDAFILTAIDKALCAVHPRYEPNIGLVSEIVAYIENDHATSVPAIAGEFAMSERSLQQLFQVYVGVGIKWVIMRARFLEATKFIRARAKPDLTAIATDFGYSDQSHFIKDFKKIVGLSPRQYITLLKSNK